MKTNEFIKELEAMGFDAKLYGYTLKVYNECSSVAKIDVKNTFSINTFSNSFDYLEETKKQQLFKLLTEYASTPIEERKEEKKYMYRLRKVDNLSIMSASIYLNYDKQSKLFCLDTKSESRYFQTTFTHSELNSQGVDIEQLQEVYEEIEVTE